MTRVCLIVLVLFGLGCKPSNSNNPESESSHQEYGVQKKAERRNLFLEFWLDMPKESFRDVRQRLIDEGVIINSERVTLEDRVMEFGIGFEYLTGYCNSIPVIPIFEDNKLVAIELIGNTCFYSIFKEKYNLPDLTNREWVTSSPNLPSLNQLGKKGIHSNELLDEFEESLMEKPRITINTERVILQRSPLDYDIGEVVWKDDIAIHIEHDEYKKYKKNIIPKPDEYLKNPSFKMEYLFEYDGVFFEGKSLGSLIFTYLSKERLLKRQEDFKRIIELNEQISKDKDSTAKRVFKNI
ncbi:MAG: hypothetical protein NXH90_14150 [Flavobacteriaceae bacterium]|nr:hypothetical protein [Flavobacteriaceae bacterium]